LFDPFYVSDPFYDPFLFAISSERDYAQHVDYVHVNRVCDWPYSSFHRYVRDGILSVDWCGDVGDLPNVLD